jgi:hypothetical protein
MSRRTIRNSASQPSGGERVFADDAGRLWSAAQASDALVFTCISDGRQAGRALASEVATLEQSVGDDILRTWLDAAPKIGTLS